jgi:VWFA-related protein
VKIPLFAGAAALVLTSVAMVSAQEPSFTIRADAVRVDVLVTDRGRIVRNLQPADFEVRDNGILQQVDVVAFEQLPLSVVLALDVSDSLDAGQREHLRDAGRILLDHLAPVDESALVTFTHWVELSAALTSDHGRLQEAMARTDDGGRTSLIDATYAAITLAESGPGRSLVLLFGDGVDTSSWLSPDATLDVASRSDVVVYAVTLGRRQRGAYLDRLTSLTGGSWIEIASTRDLASTFATILAEFRQRYVLTYTPRDVAEDGWHTLDVRLKGRRGTVQARPGYLSEP